MLDTLMQWLHLGGAIVGVGGVAFARFVLIPAAGALPPEQRGPFMAKIAARFNPILWTAIGVILMSGLYNMLSSLQAGVDIRYQAILGLKVLLALVLFTIAFLITLPFPALAGMQKRRPRWLLVNLALAALIVLLSAALRRM
ncbi:MAG TPA: CopD family protein [Candidatus Methylomirabilis sp.]|nr:CopD family protein [Candidatus Methylomirabilis sp.]